MVCYLTAVPFLCWWLDAWLLLCSSPNCWESDCDFVPYLMVGFLKFCSFPHLIFSYLTVQLLTWCLGLAIWLLFCSSSNGWLSDHCSVPHLMASYLTIVLFLNWWFAIWPLFCSSPNGWLSDRCSVPHLMVSYLTVVLSVNKRTINGGPVNLSLNLDLKIYVALCTDLPTHVELH